MNWVRLEVRAGPTNSFQGCGDVSPLRVYDDTNRPGCCPYNWCGDGTRGCRRVECVAHAGPPPTRTPEAA